MCTGVVDVAEEELQSYAKSRRLSFPKDHWRLDRNVALSTHPKSETWVKNVLHLGFAV